MEKPDCHLCAEAHRALRRIALDVRLDIERVDILTLGEAERDRYALRIPVLVVDGAELDVAGLEDGPIAAWLRDAADRSVR